MWGPLAAELGIPWRAAEAMHWQLGEVNMAHRAGVVPFSLAAVSQTATLPPANPLPGNLSVCGIDPLAGGAYPNDRTRGGYTPEQLGSRRALGQRRLTDISSPDMQRQGPGSMVLPSLAEMERGMTAFDVQALGFDRKQYDEERRKG